MRRAPTQCDKHLWIVGALLMCITGPAFGATLQEPSSPNNDETTQQTIVSQPMSIEMLERVLRRLDPDLKGDSGSWFMSLDGLTAQIVTDERADRMRIMIPVARADELTEAQLYRLMQANFESALDARYAVAQGMVWSAYIHPLAALSPQELVLAVAQTFNAALTYGDTYSSGLFQFGGGDHRADTFDEIIKRGMPL